MNSRIHRRARALLFVLATTGCSQRSAPSQTSSATPSHEPGLAGATQASTPAPTREGLEAAVVWRDPPSHRAPTDNSFGAATETLDVSEIRSDESRVYFDVTHRAGRATSQHDGASATLFVRTDHCRSRTVRVSGSVWRDWPTASTVSASLVDLPDGELDVALRAFGAERYWSFLKRGRRIEPLPLERRANYIKLPADPAHGSPIAAEGMVFESACATEVAL